MLFVVPKIPQKLIGFVRIFSLYFPAGYPNRCLSQDFLAMFFVSHVCIWADICFYVQILVNFVQVGT